MRHPSTSRHVALATLALVTITAAACGSHSSPAAPDAAASAADATAAASSELAARPGKGGAGPTVRFPLLAGTFTIATRRGAQISGTYTGETSEVNGQSVTALRLDVQSGTDDLAGASGVLEGKGRGAFTAEGEFSLDVSGSLQAGEKRTKFGLSLKGWSNIGC